MSEITVREMSPDEAAQVLRIGRRAFSGIESLWVAKPRQALVAVRGGKIVGAILYKFITHAHQKIGYVDYAFVDPDCHGQGVGKILYGAATEYLWAQGCDALTAVVKDDNVGSWGLFQNNGFVRVSLPELTRQFGFLGMLRQYFATPFCIGIGMEYYVALRKRTCPSGKGGTMKQLPAFFVANALLALFSFAVRSRFDAVFLSAYLTILLLVVFFDFIGTRFSSRRGWEFRLSNGGILVCALVGMGTALPMIGNWYPARYEKTEAFRRDMGVSALFGWAALLAVSSFAVFGGGAHPYIRTLGHIGVFLLVYRLIPFYPFESFGGRRVYRWNRWVYMLMALCTLAVVIYTFACA